MAARMPPGLTRGVEARRRIQVSSPASWKASGIGQESLSFCAEVTRLTWPAAVVGVEELDLVLVARAVGLVPEWE